MKNLIPNNLNQIITNLMRFIRAHITECVVFLAALIFIIIVSHPHILITDEWITTNQLAQINQGHQFVFNEGKYGTYENGTPNAYFQHHNNLLGYSLALPLISLPALKLVTLFGDTFDYLMISVWSLLLILLAVILRNFSPKYNTEIKCFPVSSILIMAAFIIFILNLFFYTPFIISAENSPNEVLAIVLTYDLLFAGMAVIIFKTCQWIFKNNYMTILGTIVCLANSSYFIWASNAKDHMLQVFLISIIIYGIIGYLYSGRHRYWIISFLFVGLLAWCRPEMGPSTFISVLLIFIIFTIKDRSKTSIYKNLKYLALSPIITVIGSIPLLINNYLVTGNPLIVMHTIWRTGVPEAGSTTVDAPIEAGGSSIISLLVERLSFNITTLPDDLFEIFFLPDNGCAGILIFTPLFLISILTIPIWYRKINHTLFKNEKYAIISLSLLAIAILCSYITSLHGMSSSNGIVPDMRYLCPIYLALNLIGLIIIFRFQKVEENSPKILKSAGTSFMILLIPLILGFTIFIKNSVSTIISINESLDLSIGYGSIEGFTTIIAFSTYSIVLLCTLTLYLRYMNKWELKYITYLIGLAIAIPIIWQIGAVIILYNLCNYFEGYSFWLPAVKSGAELWKLFIVIN